MVADDMVCTKHNDTTSNEDCSCWQQVLKGFG